MVFCILEGNDIVDTVLADKSFITLDFALIDYYWRVCTRFWAGSNLLFVVAFIRRCPSSKYRQKLECPNHNRHTRTKKWLSICHVTFLAQRRSSLPGVVVGGHTFHSSIGSWSLLLPYSEGEAIVVAESVHSSMEAATRKPVVQLMTTIHVLAQVSFFAKRNWSVNSGSSKVAMTYLRQKMHRIEHQMSSQENGYSTEIITVVCLFFSSRVVTLLTHLLVRSIKATRQLTGLSSRHGIANRYETF